MTKKSEAIAISPKAGAISFANRGVMPESVEALYRYAKIVYQSNLAPSGLDSPEKIVIAAETGVELGLPIQAAIRSVYVVRGVPALRGDAAKAIVYNSGLCELIKEEVSGEGEDLQATVTVKRRGHEVESRSFSIADAKKAGLIKSGSAWTTYPERMVKYRALGFALRDVFPDVLLGVHLAEEIQAERVQEAPRSAIEPAGPGSPDPLLLEAQSGQEERSPEAAGDQSSPAEIEQEASRTLGGGIETVRGTENCGLCGFATAYALVPEGAEVKFLSAVCQSCGAEFPVDNPAWDPQAEAEAGRREAVDRIAKEAKRFEHDSHFAVEKEAPDDAD